MSSSCKACLVGLFVLFVLPPMGCRSPETRAYDPMSAARAKAQFIRRHRSTLSSQQIVLLRKVPYRSSQQIQSQMEHVLELSRQARTRRDLLGERRSILKGVSKNRDPENRDDQEDETPPQKENRRGTYP